MIDELACIEVEQFQSVVTLPPYVAEEHRQLLDDAEKGVVEYEALLIEKLREALGFGRRNTQLQQAYLKEMERKFWDDPTRQQLRRNLAEIKMLVERPRFLIKAGSHA